MDIRACSNLKGLCLFPVRLWRVLGVKMTNNCQKITNNATLPAPQHPHQLTLCHSLNMGPRRNIPSLSLLLYRNTSQNINYYCMLVSQSRIFKFFSKYSIFFMGPSVHFPKSFMHCCFIYHYKERCFPGEAELNREAQNDKSLFGFHLSLTQVSGPMGRLATNGRPIRGRYRRGGVAQISSGPIHNFHCSRLGHLGFPLLHFLAGLDLNTSSTLDFSSAGSTIKWRRRSLINPMKRPLKNLYKEMILE